MKKIFTALLLSGLAAAGFGCTSPKPGSSNEPPAAPSREGEPAAKAEPAATPVQSEESGLLAVGAEAPDFTAEAHDGTTVELGKLRGQPVVLYFYPKDETPG